MTHADHTAEQARLLVDVGRTQDAIKVAYEGLYADPTNARLLGLIASALLDEGRAHEARDWAERALGCDPNAGWLHTLRARSILMGAGRPVEAVAAARTAVQINPQNERFLYTYADACIEAGDRVGARWAVRAIRHTAPASELGPLAEALLLLSRAGGRYQGKRLLLFAVLLAVVTQGSGLVFLAIWLLIRALWRIPYLKRADTLLHEALTKAPASGQVRAIAAEVLRLRFRYARSVKYDVAAAAIDGGLVDANTLARSISRRTTALAAVAAPVWIIGVAVANGLIAPDGTVAILAAGIAAVVAGVLVVLVSAFDRWQTRSLPPLLHRNVRARWPLPATVLAATGWVVLSAPLALSPVVAERGYGLACLFAAPLAIGSATVLLLRRRAAGRQIS